MFLLERLLSAKQIGAGLASAAMTFFFGLAVGATIGPVTATHRGAAIASAVTPARQPQTAARPLRAIHPAEVLRVLDGDTFEARVNLWPGLDVTTRVRLRGIDAPELKARCSEERDMAEAARDMLRTILAHGGVRIADVTLDKYGGRVVADASTAVRPDVSSALLEKGLVRRYSGGRREGWCS
jgi:endonuclease YncB( thermonuclease family)